MLPKEALRQAVVDFTALAKAYEDASESDRAADRAAVETVQQILTTLETFAAKRRAEDETNARRALTIGLSSVYLRVRGVDAPESESPPSRRTHHEGAWQTDDERRAAIARMLTRWVPGVSPEEAAEADLSAEQVEARGGPRAAADSLINALFARPRTDAGLRGATVFGLPLQG